MATKLFLRNTQTNNIGAGYYDLLTAAGAASDTAVVNTAASGTEIQFTKTAGGQAIKFVTGRAPAGGFTLTTTDISVWMLESNMLANCGGRYRVFKRDTGGTETEIGGGPFDDGVEFGAGPTEMLWSGNVTDTAIAENERLVLVPYITNVGTMASGYTCTLTFNAADAALGDSFFNIAETVAFKAEDQTLTHALFDDSVDTFYAPTVTASNTLSPGLYTDADTFYAPTVSQGGATQDLTPALFTDADTFYSPTVSATYVLTPGLFSNSNTFYGPTVAPGAVDLTPALFTDGDTFYAATVTPGAVDLTPALFTDADTFYGPTVSATYVLTPSLFSNSNTFYGPTVAPGAVNLTPALFTDSDTFYAATVSQGGATQDLTPSLFTDADTFYAAEVAAGNALFPAVYVDPDSFYPATVTASNTLTPSLYVDVDTFYAPTVSGGALLPGHEQILNAAARTYRCTAAARNYRLNAAARNYRLNAARRTP